MSLTPLGTWWDLVVFFYLVVEPTHLKKYPRTSNLDHSPIDRGENIKYLKPPPKGSSSPWYLSGESKSLQVSSSTLKNIVFGQKNEKYVKPRESMVSIHMKNWVKYTYIDVKYHKNNSKHMWNQTHTIHVWYIHLHLVDFYGFHHPMGNSVFVWREIPPSWMWVSPNKVLRPAFKWNRIGSLDFFPRSKPEQNRCSEHKKESTTARPLLTLLK